MFIKSDAGLSTSKRPKQRNCCTVRAAAIACNVSYDEAYDELKARGRKCNEGFWLPNGKRYSRDGILLNHVWTWYGIKPSKGERWPGILDIIREAPNGVMRVCGHVIAFKHGCWFDTGRGYEFATVRGYWTVEDKQ